jgi:hypothetical protein
VIARCSVNLIIRTGGLYLRGATRPAPKGRLQLPDRRITRPADRIQWQARPCLASATFNLHPAITAVQALADRWGRLGRTAIALHTNGPCFRFCPVGCTGSFPSLFTGRFGAHLRAHDPATPYDLACFGAHGWALQRRVPNEQIYQLLGHGTDY